MFILTFYLKLHEKGDMVTAVTVTNSRQDTQHNA